MERADEILRNLIKELKKERDKKPIILTSTDYLCCIPTIIHIIFILSRVQWDSEFSMVNGVQPPDINIEDKS